MQKWEYEWFSEKLGDVPQLLQKMGEQGWELVSVVHDGKGQIFYFKRPKQSPPQSHLQEVESEGLESR